MKYECVKAKTLLSRHHSAESWFHVNRTLNAYRGCEHGCVYCDGMSEYYHVDNFTTHIRIKENAPQVLRRELKKLGFSSRSELETETLWSFLDKDDAKRLAMKAPRKIIIGISGGVSDAYQQAEREHKITRQVLETLLDFELPASILTKSDLVLRDLDLLKEIHNVAFVNAMFTITKHDDTLRRIFEPKSSPSEDRFAALKELRKAGLYGGVFAMPIIPFIGWDYDNMIGLANEAKKAGAEFILFAGMTLKPGRQKEYFFNVVRKHFPDKLPLIKKAYSNNNTYGLPLYKHLPINTMLRGFEVCKKVGIPFRSVRHKLPDEFDSNNQVLGILLDIVFFQSMMLGHARNKNRPFHEAATKIENGIEDLNLLKDEGQLSSRLQVSDKIAVLIEEILETGRCRYLEELKEKCTSEEGPGALEYFE